MTPIDQIDTIAAGALGPREQARFWTDGRLDDLACLSATFHTHVYAPHTHDTFVLGTIVAGCEGFTIDGIAHRAAPGELAFVHPGQVHDGRPESAGYHYRMCYPPASLLADLIEDVSGRPARGTVAFPSVTVRDPELAASFAAAHGAVERAPDRFESEEAMFSALTAILVRHARIAPAVTGREPTAIRRAMEVLAEDLTDSVPLRDVAAAAGLSRSRLIATFREATGLTPRAWLTNLRVQRAAEQLRAGQPPVDVALATGFCDQSHLNRAFKARLGVTPGVYREAHLPRARISEPGTLGGPVRAA